MQLDLIQCTVRANIDGDISKLEVVKAGPAAITPAEAVILMMKHSLDETATGCALRNVIKVGVVEREKDDEMKRLRREYGVIVDQAFPRGRQLPRTINDIDIPEECMGKPREEPKPLDPRKAMRAILEANGVEVPKGNLSKDDLQALMDEHGLAEAS